MKQITITKCGECPYCEQDSCYTEVYECSSMFGGKDFIRVDRSTIHKDCPLMDKVSRENALITITMFKADKIKAHEALNKLGFTEKEGE